MTEWRTFKEIEMDKIRIFPVLNQYFYIVKNIDNIHPLKQKKIFDFCQKLTDFPNIKRCWIFGSSTNNCCNINSDVDILLEINDSINMNSDEGEDLECSIHKIIVKTIGTNFDLIYLNNLDKNKQIYKNILKTRRLVYECND